MILTTPSPASGIIGRIVANTPEARAERTAKAVCKYLGETPPHKRERFLGMVLTGLYVEIEQLQRGRDMPRNSRLHWLVYDK